MSLFKWDLNNPILRHKFLLIPIIVLAAISIFVNDKTPNISNNKVTDSTPILTKAAYGNKYPYTIDNLKLHCKDNAVWLEDNALNKYAVNGLAYNLLKDEKDFKGYDTEISLDNPDLPGTKLTNPEFLTLGLSLCKK